MAGTQQAHGRQLLVIYLALMLALLLASLDQTIVSTAATQVWGKLGDQYGRKYLFLGAIVIFLIGSTSEIA